MLIFLCLCMYQMRAFSFGIQKHNKANRYESSIFGLGDFDNLCSRGSKVAIEQGIILYELCHFY